MSQIDDLKESISTMDENKLMALLRDVRQSRRVTKRQPPAKKAQTQKASVGIEALFDKLSNEEKLKFLEKLRGGADGT